MEVKVSVSKMGDWSHTSPRDVSDAIDSTLSNGSGVSLMALQVP